MRILFFSLGLAILCSCGYSTRGFTYKEDKIVIIPVSNNIEITPESRRYSNYRSFPVFLEKRLTHTLRNRFSMDGHLMVVKEDVGALSLECAIKDYQKEALRYSDSDEIKEQRLRLFVQMKLWDEKGKLLKEKEVVGEATYFLTGPNQKSEASAQEELIEDTARRILEQVVESW